MCLSVAVHRPNDVLGQGAHCGFEWSIVHNGLGYRCGYVRVPIGHPWYGKSWEDDIDVAVHGGVTFGEKDEPCDKGGVDDSWWIGFDCAHSGDAQDPELPANYHMPAFGIMRAEHTVRTQEYVEAECRSLCEQAAEAAKPQT